MKNLKTPYLLILGIVLVVIGGTLGAFLTYKAIVHLSTLQPNIKLPKKASEFIKVEKEPNNTFDQASPLQPGYEMQGSFSTDNDVDIYSFHIDSPSRIQINLKNLPREYNMFVYDQNKQIIASSIRTGFDEGHSIIKIPSPGIYYIKLTIGNTSQTTATGTYWLSLDILSFGD